MPRIFMKSRGPRDLALAMIDVKMGERFVHVGTGDPRVFAALAGKVGLTGRAFAVVADAAAAQAMEAAGAEEGVLVEVESAPAWNCSLAPTSFDVAMVDGNMLAGMTESARPSCLREAHRILRPGARLLVMFRGRRGLAAWFGIDRPVASAEVPRLSRALGMAGFRPVRLLADREGLAFIEGFRT
jgi:SAM-dependent methyltransferase